MELTALNSMLRSHRIGRLNDTVVTLETAIAAGMVPNSLLIEAKDLINRICEEAADAYLNAGQPYDIAKSSYTAERSAAYNADAFVTGAHTLPAVIKRARKTMPAYTAFLETNLMPLRNLLEAAKPLVKKRGELPKVMTPKQQAEDAKRMTCQCCGRRILAETGTIAHHGYERPQHGWQTSSCGGAKELPFEVSRDQLGKMIEHLEKMRRDLKAGRKLIAAEKAPITCTFKSREDGSTRIVSIKVTAANFNQPEIQNGLSKVGHYATFANLLKRELANRDSELRQLDMALTEHTSRYQGWKQTHHWQDGQWASI
jgi:hypothetical protein